MRVYTVPYLTSFNPLVPSVPKKWDTYFTVNREIIQALMGVLFENKGLNV